MSQEFGERKLSEYPSLDPVAEQFYRTAQESIIEFHRGLFRGRYAGGRVVFVVAAAPTPAKKKVMRRTTREGGSREVEMEIDVWPLYVKLDSLLGPRYRLDLRTDDYLDILADKEFSKDPREWIGKQLIVIPTPHRADGFCVLTHALYKKFFNTEFRIPEPKEPEEEHEEKQRKELRRRQSGLHEHGAGIPLKKASEL